jgi:hypothetical protein
LEEAPEIAVAILERVDNPASGFDRGKHELNMPSSFIVILLGYFEGLPF